MDMNATIFAVATNPVEINNSFEYIIGAIIALVILCYLIYSLVKPEKF
jgi:K+-transporting ATPase KdpF subunit